MSGAAPCSVTVLGSAGSHPGPDRACAAHLVSAGSTRVLLDCGTGSLTRLMEVCAPARLDALVLSHRHADHLSDVWGLRLARKLAGAHPPLPVLGPADALDVLPALVGDGDLSGELEPRAVGDGAHLTVGELSIELAAVAHPVPTLACAVEHRGRRLVYSADGEPCEALDRLAAGCDLLLCEATWLAADGPHPPGLHHTAAQAGALAERAGAGRLVLTHLQPGVDPDEARAEAAAACHVPVEVADDRDRFTLG